MTKLKTLILLLIAVLLLSSCGTIKEELGFGDKAGLSYNDLSISEIDLDADIKALESNKEFSDQFTDEIIIPTKDNCFLIERSDGSYDLYLNGKYMTTLTDKQYCIPNINTYKNINEASKHEQIISEK